MRRLPTLISALIIAVMAIAVQPLSAQRQKTTRKLPRVSVLTATKSSEVTLDTIVTETGDLSLNGYDKPLRSRRESLFVTNNTSRHARSLSIGITYADMKGRQLHRRSVRVACDIPAGETRQITFPAWDRQQAFYYRLSEKPQRASGTPYDVKCRVDTLFTLTTDIPADTVYSRTATATTIK